MVLPETVVKYVVFILNSLAATLAAGVVVAGCILDFILNNIIPFKFPPLAFLWELPVFLIIAGSLVLVISFLGSTGSILDGKPGKYLLRAHMIAVAIVVVLGIYILIVLQISHRGVPFLPKPSRLTSSLDVAQNIPIDLETKSFNSHKNPFNKTCNTDVEKDIRGDNKTSNSTDLLVRRHRSIFHCKSTNEDFSNCMQSIINQATAIRDIEVNKNREEDYNRVNYTTIAEHLAQIIEYSVNATFADRKGNSLNNSKTVVTLHSDKIIKDDDNILLRKRRGLIGAVIGGVTNVIGGAINLTMTLTKTASFFIDIVTGLSGEERNRVKLVAPLLGPLVAPAYRLSAYPAFMIVATIFLILEIGYLWVIKYLFDKKFPATILDRISGAAQTARFGLRYFMRK